MENSLNPVVSLSKGPETVAISLDVLSGQLKLSKQTLVQWVDRHLIEASLTWNLLDGSEEQRIIELSPETIQFLESFAEQYRQDVVSCSQARRILKIVDRRKVKKMIRAEDIVAVEVEGEKRVLVGSLEDYLRRIETTV